MILYVNRGMHGLCLIFSLLVPEALKSLFMFPLFSLGFLKYSILDKV